MSEKIETNATQSTIKPDAPILRLNRLTYVRVTGKILDATAGKLDRYIEYATAKMNTEINHGDIIEHGLMLLFERDQGFKNWLKQS